MPTFCLPIRVYYEDTDAGGVVYHTNYLKFMERARTEWLRHLGFEQLQLKEKYNLLFVVRSLSINYHKPAFFDDQLRVVAELGEKITKVSLVFLQKIYRDDLLLCSAEVSIVSVNAQTFRPKPIPDVVLQILKT